MTNGLQTVLVILGDGFEEIEAIAPIDILRRAGVQVVVASREPRLVVIGRNGISVAAEVALDDVAARDFDCIIVPGGPGTAEMREDERVHALLRRHDTAHKLIAAICAAPLVLADAGVLLGRRYTGHASIAAELPDLEPEQPVIVDDNVLTSRGAGTAVTFALALVERLCGGEVSEGVAKSIHYRADWG